MSMGKGQTTRGDIRLDRRRDAIMTGIVTRHSLVERKAGGDRAGEISMLNYLASPNTSIKDILAPDMRDKRRKGLGPAGDGETPGFFIHPVIAIDADDETVIGPRLGANLDAQAWCGDAAPWPGVRGALEGGTQRQKNPWKKGSLSWLAWAVASLGGWNCYYKPPGPKTMADSWRRLEAMLAGCAITRALHHV